MKNSFSTPDIGFMEKVQVESVLHSGRITTGQKTKELGSQTVCAEMTLCLLGVGYGDEVIAV